ncbi:MAG: hypothetical protein ACR2RL_05125 [Gammaproteobacteria bacterium]
MSSRRTVLIPAVALGNTRTTRVLELIVEAAGPPGTRPPDTRALRSQGLEPAFDRAHRAIRNALAREATHLERLRRLLYRSPTLYLASPASNLSEAKGADLGIALGLLMYFGYCRATRVLATGHLSDGARPSARDVDAHALARHLGAALRLGPQPERLPFLVLLDPYEITPDVTALLAELVETLHRAGIEVLCVSSLISAVQACSTFKTSLETTQSTGHGP